MSRHIVPMIIASMLVSSCVTIQQGGELDDFKDEITSLESTIELNPSNADANRDLGVIYYRVSEYGKARQYLSKTLALNERDAKARFYYGMTLESLDDIEAAMGEYINYSDYSFLSPYRKLMEGRFRSLSRDIISSQIRDIVASELSLTDRDADPNVVAVFPLRYVGTEERYAAVGYGLAELLIVDLGQVQRIRLVERIRLDELLDELQLSQSAAFDQATTVKIGQFLKAGNVIGGTYSISPEEALRTDVTSRISGATTQAEPIVRSEDLDRFFRLEKSLVFDLLAQLGVEPTPLEKERIERIPTQNVMAFILYSIGLERESKKDFIAARTFYREAVTADANFTLALDRMNAMEAMVLAGSVNDARLNALTLDAESAVSRDRDIVGSRMNALLGNIGFDPYPGSDGRTSPSDAHRGLAPILPLMGPPNPPVNK